ncbi:hypothetical protein [Dongshaea marina]|uniref:hypothetical protein n=1 Tax=Dongshaea marina TaxID=2047966 RepID=UPI00131F329C|nr:hypothetical protein [Dongshaea marina]
MESMGHGSYTLSFNGDLLLATATGSWNEVTSKEYFENTRQIITSNNPAVWGMVVDCRTFEQATPEAWKMFDEMYLWLAKHNMLCLGLVYHSNMFKHLVERLEEHTNESPLYGQHFSEDYAEVYAWCLNRILEYRRLESLPLEVTKPEQYPAKSSGTSAQKSAPGLSPTP